MKLNRILIILTVGLAFALPSTSLAGKGRAKRGAGHGRRIGQVVRGYDKNGNGQIDGEEIEALKNAFAADPKGPLAALDKNSNGTLDDDEIAAINARMGKHAEQVAKREKKNNKT